jgi:hypothetical protein
VYVLCTLDFDPESAFRVLGNLMVSIYTSGLIYGSEKI